MKAEIYKILMKENIGIGKARRLSEELLNLHLVSDMFSFANFLDDKYGYIDNTELGDIYACKITGKEFTEKQVYLRWLKWK